MKVFASLTSRLVVTAVALVLVVCVLIGTVTTVAMRNYLLDKLDDQVQETLHAALSGRPTQGPGLGSRFGTVTAVFADDGETVARRVTVSSSGAPRQEALESEATRALEGLRPDARVHGIDLHGLGGYRVVAQAVPGGTVVVGLPSNEVHDALVSLIRWEAILTLLGVLAAGLAGSYVVRRQLRPLREVAATAHTVAELPLASGEVSVEERVPERLTDEATEVGQVGAALNTLLEHVESSLAARQRSEQQVRQFVADASHELRTPLTTIRGYTELAQQRPGDVPLALAKVEEESSRMASLVEDMLLLARLDQGRPLEKEPVDLTKLLLEAVDDARVVASDHTWHLQLPAGIDPEEDVSVVVPGDAQRLHQVITNLLTNARRYTPAGTTVTVSVRPDGFAVHDDGPGFPPELIPRAFERFTRGDSARQRDGGAGLGLSLVHAIVTSHGGQVTLASKPGDTTISVRLPPG